MPRKIRQLISDLERVGWRLLKGAGKGSHRKFSHTRVSYRVMLSGQNGADARPYQESDVKKAVRDASQQR